MAYIRRAYGVPAKRGGRVILNPDHVGLGVGRIVSASGQYLRVRFDSGTCTVHPGNVIYLDQGKS